MTALEMIASLFSYSDWATGELLRVAGQLADAPLDQKFEMGPGTLRRTLQHIHHFEAVYLDRWQDRGATAWPPYEDQLGVAALADRCRETWAARDRYLAGLADAELSHELRWRDSRGGWYRAVRSDALVQVCSHSMHHRAQAVNMIRRLTGESVELDHMMHVREPA